MVKGAHIDTRNIDERVVAKYPEIRDLIYEYVQANGSIDPAKISDPKVLGRWKFVPDSVYPQLEMDRLLLFGRVEP